jgi:hypothetical protein
MTLHAMPMILCGIMIIRTAGGRIKDQADAGGTAISSKRSKSAAGTGLPNK